MSKPSLCEHCSRAEFRGLPSDGAPEWEVGTVYFWCPTFNTHHQYFECEGHMEGEPRMYDKHGKAVKR